MTNEIIIANYHTIANADSELSKRIRDEKLDVFYVGRGNQSHNLRQSPLANPFKLQKESERDTVVEKYKAWLWHQIKTKSEAFRFLVKLTQAHQHSDIVLVCWCAPKRCHAAVVADAVRWLSDTMAAVQ